MSVERQRRLLHLIEARLEADAFHLSVECVLGQGLFALPPLKRGERL